MGLGKDLILAATLTILAAAPAYARSQAPARARSHKKPTPTPSATPSPVPSATATPASTPKPSATPTATPSGTAPIKANDFLNSLGVCTKRTQGIDSVSQIETALSYSGIRNIRDDGTANSGLWSDFCGIHAATGATVTLLPILNVSTPDLSEYDALAACGAIVQVEGPNEPNNFPFTYQGQTCGGASASTYAACAAFQRDLYNAVKADPNLAGIPVLQQTEVGFEPDNQGLQFLTIPSPAITLQPEGTVYADVANLHNYVQGNPPNQVLGDNQAWRAEWPGQSLGAWDGLAGEFTGRTWRGNFNALPFSAGPGLPKETSETGWQTGTSGTEITQDQQAKLLVNVYLSAAKLNWKKTYIYQMFDGPTDTFGLFIHNGSGAAPKLAGIYIHNLSAVIDDSSSLFSITPVAYSVGGETSTIHDLLLEKSSGVYELAVWGDRPVSGTVTPVTVNLPHVYPTINVYDVTSGTTPIDRFSDASSVPLTIADHALVVEFGG